MNDRELLELAAKAAGYDVAIAYQPDVPRGLYVRHEDKTFVWMPLIDDGDALRLAVKLELQVRPNDYDTMVGTRLPLHIHCAETHHDDSYAATRRAIVRAAAEIGKEQE